MSTGSREVGKTSTLGKVWGMTTTEVHVHVHLDGSADNVSVSVYLPADTELEGLIMATREEIVADVAEVKALLVELQKDVTRVIADLEAALANNDLEAVAAAVADLKATTTTIDDAVEAASPEPTEPEPTP